MRPRPTDRKIVYIAHQLSGDVGANLRAVAKVYRWALLEMEVIPLMPWFECCYALDDNSPEERKKGIEMDHELLRRLPFDELWLTGPTISSGMRGEIELANALGIPVLNFTGGGSDVRGDEQDSPRRETEAS